jgi:hypothetical protein
MRQPDASPAAEIACAPSPSPSQQQADIATLPIAVQYAPSDPPLAALVSEGFDGLA